MYFSLFPKQKLLSINERNKLGFGDETPVLKQTTFEQKLLSINERNKLGFGDETPVLKQTAFEQKKNVLNFETL